MTGNRWNSKAYPDSFHYFVVLTPFDNSLS